MKYEKIVDLFADMPFFESEDVHVLFEEPRGQVRARLSRWVSKGKLIKLRRKKYLLPERYRKVEPASEYISNFLYRPSYVSLRTAFSIYGMIPETVHLYEAVTPRKTAEWDTPAGNFKYYSIKEDRFWGYRLYPEEAGPKTQKNFLLGEPEKVLLDFFYLIRGEWSGERIEEMRFQNLSTVKKEKLLEYSERFSSPKVRRGVDRFIEIYSEGLK